MQLGQIPPTEWLIMQQCNRKSFSSYMSICHFWDRLLAL
jgi:hypothetical protein